VGLVLINEGLRVTEELQRVMRQAMLQAPDDMKEYIEAETNEQPPPRFEVARDDNSRVCIGTQLRHADSVF
jgi:hypothetical protein